MQSCRALESSLRLSLSEKQMRLPSGVLPTPVPLLPQRLLSLEWAPQPLLLLEETPSQRPETSPPRSSTGPFPRAHHAVILPSTVLDPIFSLPSQSLLPWPQMQVSGLSPLSGSQTYFSKTVLRLLSPSANPWLTRPLAHPLSHPRASLGCSSVLTCWPPWADVRVPPPANTSFMSLSSLLPSRF